MIDQRFEHSELTDRIIGAGIAVHRELGPGLLESAYEECMGFEMRAVGIQFDKQVPLPVVYRSNRLDCGYRLDFVVENAVVLELKAVDKLAPIHEAQLLTYLRLSRKSVGLLMNFNVAVLKDGILRRALTPSTSPVFSVPSASQR
jgi:GxxExxY protein